MIAGFEILGIVFLLIMMYVSFVSYKRKSLDKMTLSFWLIVWLIGILMIIFNAAVKSFLPSLSVMRVFDLYTILGFMFFLFMIFYLFNVVKRSEKRIEELTREIAIKEMHEHKHNKDAIDQVKHDEDHHDLLHESTKRSKSKSKLKKRAKHER